MINLLPPELKENYVYARRNRSLLDIIAAFCAGIGGLVVISLAGFVYLQQTANAYSAQASADEARLRTQNQADTEKKVREISNELKLAVQVLSKEVLFSQLLTQLAVITPSNARLTNVEIAKVGGGLDISAEAVDYKAATQLQVNMADPNSKIFAKADIVSINCSHDPSDHKPYPCQAIYRALFTTNNPYLFINDGKGGR